MVGTSKILTVSYGTFSCTLEGFDDSFSTMKAIAEYFRGLASEDRYFGAEPPTPDADMLAQIAEREISRRVDASMDDGSIHLRAAALTDQSASQDDTSGETAEIPHDKESRAEVNAARKAKKAARKAEKAIAKAEAKAARQAEKQAEKAAQAEAAAKAEVAAKAEAEAKVKSAAEETSEAASKDDVETASKPDDTTSDTSLLSSVSAATAELPEGTHGSEVEETRDVALSSVLAAEDPAPTDTATKDVPAHPDTQSIAAKLQRIRAVVATNDRDEAASDDLSAQFLPQTETPDVADVNAGDDESKDPVAEFDAHVAEMEQSEDTSEPDVSDDAPDGTSDADAPVDGSDDMISRVMARHDDVDAADTNADDDAPAEDAAAPQARVIRMKRADFEKAVADGEIDEPDRSIAPSSDAGPDFGLLDGADELDEYLEDSDFADGDATGLDDTSFAEELAEIEADFADTSENHVEVSQDDASVSDDDGPDATTLSAISGALAADNAKVEDAVVEESVIEESVDDETVDDEDAVEDDASEMADVDTAEEPQVDDAALDRLLSETDAQMQEPEGSRRRDAISQLKAAVAAKEAARQVGEPDDDDQDAENAFRNDLSEAVRPETGARPRPVVRSGTRTERPRPAPLKLVAAQRVDLEDAQKRDTPVVPRRVAARIPDAHAQSAGSFAEFAENMGASELPDLLEAAAAYTAFVEGADEFSRPQILRRVRAVASDDFNREDGLRSFADLLKTGRITKVRNGRFQVADDSRFNPERRAS